MFNYLYSPSSSHALTFIIFPIHIDGGKSAAMLASKMRKLSADIKKHVDDYNAVVKSVPDSGREAMPGCERLDTRTLGSRLGPVGIALDPDSVHFVQAQGRSAAKLSHLLFRICEEEEIFVEDERYMKEFLGNQVKKSLEVSQLMLGFMKDLAPDQRRSVHLMRGCLAHVLSLHEYYRKQSTYLEQCLDGRNEWSTFDWINMNEPEDDLSEGEIAESLE